MLRSLVCVLLLLALQPALARTLRYQGGGHPYYVDVLKLVSEQLGEPVTLTPVFDLPPQERTIRLLEKPGGIDIFWGITTQEREQRALAVQIPIDKGLIGYRVPVIEARNRNLLATAREIGDLNKIIFGLGNDWPDTAVFRANGLSVTTFIKSSSQYGMLASGRFDVFPDNILDYSNESLPPGLEFDQHLLFHYPSAMYFFVAKRDPVLHRQLTAGLEKIVKSGQLDALFSRHFGELIERMKLKERRKIELVNPEMPASVLQEQPNLWFNEKEFYR